MSGHCHCQYFCYNKWHVIWLVFSYKICPIAEHVSFKYGN